MPKWLADDIAVLGLDAALDLTAWATSAYTGDYFYAEMEGLCAGAGAGKGRATACFKRVRRVHMLAGLTQGHCSLFGAWGAATANNHTLQLRALDWDMDGPFRDHPVVTVYHANGPKENSFATVSFTGMIGALTGVSDQRLGISEIGVSYPDKTFGAQARVGYPFIFLLRDILQFDTTVDDASNRMINTQRTCDLILAVGDAKEKLVRGFEYSYHTLDMQDDINMRPKNDTWHFRLPEMIYWGMDWLCPGYTQVLGTQLRKHHGTLTPELAISDVVAVEGSGDVHIAVYDLTEGLFYVSFAAPRSSTGPTKAYARQYTLFTFDEMFGEAKPHSSLHESK